MNNVAMIVFSPYPADQRVRREAEALAQEGISVDVLCVKKQGEVKKEMINGVCAYRLPVQHKRTTKYRYLWEYSLFILLAFIMMTFLYIRKRYCIIHIHNMPDILVLAAIIPRIMGVRIVLDLHDPMPEVYMAKYNMAIDHPIIKVLIYLERFSIWFSDVVLTPNIAFRNHFISRGCPDWKIHIVMNSPNKSLFHYNNILPDYKAVFNRDKFEIMYHGTVVERHGLDTALEAMSTVSMVIPNLVFHVYGEGDFVDNFLQLVDKLKLNNIVRYYGYKPIETIVEAIKSADLGIIPNKLSPFTNINMPTRIFEYLSMGKPVIAPATRGVLDYFDEESLFFFKPGSAENLAEVILEVYSNSAKTQSVLTNGISVYLAHRWELEKKHFVEIIKGLLLDNAFGKSTTGV